MRYINCENLLNTSGVIMECDKVQELLPYIDDGSLGRETTDMLREHLLSCPECREVYGETKRVVEMVTKTLLMQDVQPASEFLSDLQNRIAQRRQASRTFRWIASAAAVFLVAVFAGLYVYFSPNTQPFEVASVDTDEAAYTEYIAEMFFTTYDMYELADEAGVINETDLEEVLIEGGYYTITYDDIFENLDETEMSNLFSERKVGSR